MSKIIWFVIIAVIVGGVAYFWLQGRNQESFLINDSAFENLNKLTTIKLDTSFFTDPEFSNLQPVPRINIATIQRGRPNPFIPLARR